MNDSNKYLIGFAGLSRLLESGVDFPELGPRLETRVNTDPSDANALMDLSTLLFLTGNPDYRILALEKQQRALEISQTYHLQPRADTLALRLLVIMAPGGMTANTPVDCLLEEADIQVTMLYVLPGHPLPRPLPPHDLIFVAVGESDQNQILLRQLQDFSKFSPKPVVNSPDKIILLTRNRVSTLLGAIPGVLMPATVRTDRQSLLKVGQGDLVLTKLLGGGRFPVIVRPVTSHGGKNLAKIDNPPDLSPYLESLPDDEFYISNFIDYRSRDGQFRKYRVVLLAGRPYACHMAISSHWMIHYFNADMDTSSSKRDEEELFMTNFDGDFAERHRQSLASIHRFIGLDLVSIDCAETQDGVLLLFEVDNAAIVHALDDPNVFPYKLSHMRKIFSAFREMLILVALHARDSAGPDQIRNS